MTTNFPSSIDNFTNPTSSSTMASPSHSAQHADVNDAVEAIETALLDGAPLFIDDVNERVGIGTTSPQRLLDIRGASNPEIRFQSTDSSNPAIYFGDQIDAVRSGIRYNTADDRLELQGYNNSTRLAIDSSGNVGIGNTSPSERLQVAGNIRIDGDLTIEGYTNTGQPSGNIVSYASGSVAAWSSGCTSDGGRNHMRFSSPSYSAIGAIYTSYGNTYYANYSDYRLKDNVTPLANASDIVSNLKPISYTMRYSPEATHLGFLAHELQEHVPSAVGGQKDEVDNEGNPVYQNVDLSKVVPVLTAALKEALTTISELTARIEALEAS